ncbi:MAG: hypothetical protein Q9165_000582 [Trypethelium subeluteriae]
MHSHIVALVLLAGYCASAPAPAPQLPDFNLIYDAPTPSVLGPPPVGGDQTSVFDVASALASATADVTTVASASFTGTAALNGKRDAPTDTTSYGAPTSSSSVYTSQSLSSSSSLSTPTVSTSASVSGYSTTTAAPPTATTCKAEPDGYGPRNLSVTEFQHNPLFTLDALLAPTPRGYVNTFRNVNASVEANSYLGYYDLKSYDTNLCAQHCDNTTLCTSFDIYVERDPSVNPNAGLCPNPDAITNYKCALWGSSIDKAAAINYGQYRADFHVVIAASNGYEKTNTTTPASCPGWKPPTNCGGAISGSGWHLGSNFFPGPFDPAICAAYAEAQTSYNHAHADSTGKYSPVNMFNAYMMKKNGIAQGTFCALFTTILDKSFGSYTGSWVGSDFFGVETSWTYALTVQDTGIVKR